MYYESPTNFKEPDETIPKKKIHVLYFDNYYRQLAKFHKNKIWVQVHRPMDSLYSVLQKIILIIIIIR